MKKQIIAAAVATFAAFAALILLSCFQTFAAPVVILAAIAAGALNFI
jgi:hypothetical protein